MRLLWARKWALREGKTKGSSGEITPEWLEYDQSKTEVTDL